ncbi:hypothetical protein M1271_00230 [Patescibacteria group bacterium]|nr:hypothetical protein [Patescibacteria group bacterium]
MNDFLRENAGHLQKFADWKSSPFKPKSPEDIKNLTGIDLSALQKVRGCKLR